MRAGIKREFICKRKIPQVVKIYNKYISGIDKLDFLIAMYQKIIRSKKGHKGYLLIHRT